VHSIALPFQKLKPDSMAHTPFFECHLGGGDGFCTVCGQERERERESTKGILHSQSNVIRYAGLVMFDY
jgi:hypothetical protein